MSTALEWVNPVAAHVQVFEFVDHCMFMVPFAAHVSTFEHVNYCGACGQLDKTVGLQSILPQALRNEYVVIAGSMDYTTTDVITQMRELFDLMCLHPVMLQCSCCKGSQYSWHHKI